MHEGTERRLDSNAVMSKLNEIQRDIDTLNTRLFGNPEGDPGDEGRLVIAERRINDHANRLQRLERYVAGALMLAAAAKLVFEHWKI